MAQQTNELKIVLSAQDRNLNKILSKADNALRRLSRTAARQGVKTSNALDRMAMRTQAAMTKMKAALLNLRSAFLVLAGVAVIKSVIKLSAAFEKSLANINTLLDGTGVSIKRFESQLVEMSKTSSKDILDLSKGLYQTISAGIPAIEGASGAMATLDAAQKAAVAGLSSTEDAVNGVVSVVNAYGAENISAAEASDKLLKTVQLGRTTFPELANAIGRVAPMAAKFGISIDEVLGMLVMLTRQGINTNEAVTGLRSMIKGLAQPTGKTQKVIDNLNKSLGKGSRVAFGAAALEANGLMGQIEKLTVATGGSADMMSKLFPNVRAVLPALVSVGKGSEATAGFVRALGNSAGTTAKAVAKVAPTFSETSNIFKSQVQAVFIKAGTEVLPLLNKRIKELGSFLVRNESSIVSFFGTLIRGLDHVGTVMKFIGGPTAKAFLAVFAGKMIRSFANMIILHALPALRSLSTTAMTAMANVRGAMVSGMQGGIRGMATAWKTSIDTTWKGNMGALKGAFARLPSVLGLVSVGMHLGKSLGNWIGKGLVGIFRAGAFEEAQQEAEAQTQKLMQSLWAQGFTGIEEFKQLEASKQGGEVFQFTEADIKSVNVKLKLNTEIVSTDALDPVDRFMALVNERLSNPSGIDLTKPLLEDLKLFSPANRAKVEKAMAAYMAKFKSWRVAVNKQMETIGSPDNVTWKARAAARKAFVAEAKATLHAAISASDGVIKTQEKIGKTSTAGILQNIRTQKERYINLQKFMAQEEQLRLAKGMSAEKAAAEAKVVTLTLIEAKLTQNEVRREKALAIAKDTRAELKRQLPAYNRLHAIAGNFSKLQALGNKELSNQYLAQRAVVQDLSKTLKSNLNLAHQRLANERQNLLVIKNKLGLEREINEARKAAAKKAEDDRKKQEKIAKWRAYAAKQRAAQLAVAAALNQLERKGLDLVVRRLAFAEAMLKYQLDLNKAKIDAATSDEERIKLLQERQKILGQLGKAQKATEAKRTGIRELEAEQGSRRTLNVVQTKGKLAKKTPEEIAAIELKEATRLEKEKAVLSRESKLRLQKIDGQTARKQAAAQKQINKLATSGKKQAGKEQAAADKKAEEALRKRIQLYFGDNQKRQDQAKRFAKEKGITEQAAQKEIFALQQKITSDSDVLRDAFIEGKVAAEGIRNTFKQAGEIVRHSIALPLDVAAQTVGGTLALDFNKVGDSLANAFTNVAQKLTGFLEIGLVKVFDVGIGAFAKGADSLISGHMFPKLNEWGSKAADFAGSAGETLGTYLSEKNIPLLSIPFALGAAAGAGTDGKTLSAGIQKGFQVGSKFLVEGLVIFAKGLTGAMQAVLNGFVQLFSKVISSVLKPAMSALQAPVDTILGGLGEAVGVLTQRPSGKEAEQRSKELEDRRALLQQEMASRVASAQSNEDVAAIQSEYADKLANLRDEAGQEEDTPADMITKAVEDALAMAEAVLGNLPSLIENFMTKLTEAIPVLVPKLVEALAGALVALAQNLGPLIKNLVQSLMDAMPLLIDALVESVPLIIEALIDGLIVLVESLPDFIISLIDGFIEMLPRLFESLAEKLPDLIVALVEAVPHIITAIIMRLPAIIWALVQGLGLLVIKLLAAVPRIVGALIAGIWKGLKPLGKFFKMIGSGFASGVRSAIDWVMGGFRTVINWFKDIFTGNWFHGGGVIRPSTSSGMQKAWREMGVAGYQTGGMVGAIGSNFRASLNDNIPALLQAGEGILNRQAMANLGGAAGLAKMNRGEGGGSVTSVNVSLSPSSGAESAIAEVLLPLLIGGVATQVSEGTGDMTTALDQRDYGPLGFRGVPGSK